MDAWGFMTLWNCVWGGILGAAMYRWGYRNGKRDLEAELFRKSQLLDPNREPDF
jgi:hypothetical protein